MEAWAKDITRVAVEQRVEADNPGAVMTPMMLDMIDGRVAVDAAELMKSLDFWTKGPNPDA